MSPPRKLGTVLRRWGEESEHGRIEHIERVGAIAECPKCGADVELLQETDGGTELEPGSRVYHADSWGPSMGECCGSLIADWWEGCFTFEPHGPDAP